ncbi:MAG: hypothetical protein ABL921_35485, partial [Pirellula sp.]
MRTKIFTLTRCVLVTICLTLGTTELHAGKGEVITGGIEEILAWFGKRAPQESKAVREALEHLPSGATDDVVRLFRA